MVELLQNRRFLLVPFLLGTLGRIASAQPDTLWTRAFGGDSEDYGRSVQQTVDGGFIVVGETFSFGPLGTNIWLIKTDESGNEQWNKTFGGDSEDYGHSVQQTADGGYIIVGQTFSFGPGEGNIYLIKTDTSGNEEWSKTFGGDFWYYGYSVQKTSDNGYIVAGEIYSLETDDSNILLMKTDGSGDELWSSAIGADSTTEKGWYVQESVDGGYVVAGVTYPLSVPGKADLLLIKTDDSGNLKWRKTFGGEDYDWGWSVEKTADGGYVISGMTRSYGAGDSDVWVIKTDQSGNEEWNKTFGGHAYDQGHSVVETMDGGYIVAGYTFSFGAGESDAWVIKTDAFGNEEWNKTLGGKSEDWVGSIQQTSDGGYILAGITRSFGAGGADLWLIRFKGEDVATFDEVSLPQRYTLLQNYPNPFNPATTIEYDLPEQSFVTLKIYNVMGHEVRTLVNGAEDAGYNSLMWDGKDFNGNSVSSGMYLYRLDALSRESDKEFHMSRKMVLLR